MIRSHGRRAFFAPAHDSMAPRGALSPVKDPIISQYAEACGASGPLDLRVDPVGGGRRVTGSIQMPFALVGRDDACDVTLTDPEVNPRHAWFQVVGGRVFVVDLGSRAGLEWPGRGTGSAWLDVGVPVRIGPFHLRLCSSVSPRPASFPPGYSPLQSDTSLGKYHPNVTLEFRNGKRAKDQWAVNRLVTLVGRAPECKIRLSSDDIAAYHCGLVLTTDGLWVVDLSGSGVVVNGERMRVSPLRAGGELWVGRFLIGLHYPQAAPQLPRPAVATSQPSPKDPTPPPRPALADPPEDEVPVGVAPQPDSLSGLPSSHIMADAFRLWTAAAGALSNPILVTGSGPVQHFGSVAPRSRPAVQSPLLELIGTTAPEESAGAAPAPTLPHPAAAAVMPLLHELGELHGQMLAHFQQSLVLMVQLFACLRRDQIPAMQKELARIQELNSELAQLQVDVVRQAEAEPAPTPPPRGAPVGQTPPPPDSTALHNWVTDRISTLQRERHALWQSLVGLFSNADGGPTEPAEK